MTKSEAGLIRRLSGVLPRSVRRRLSGILSPDAAEAETAAVSRNIDEAGRHTAVGRLEEAERLLRRTLAEHPMDLRLGPHLSRIAFLRSRAADPATAVATEELHRVLALMDAELRRNQLYVPAEFWRGIGGFHREMLALYGLENFKRTVSHQYQNWLMISEADPQVARLFETWSTHGSLQPWSNVIETPDHVGFHRSQSIERPGYPLVQAEKREIYRLAVGLLWEYVRHTDPRKLLDHLEENEIGNPVRVWRNGIRISSDLAHSVRERNLLLDTLGLDGKEAHTVAELGAGYGRLAEIFGRTTNYRYFIFDITPALYVSQWYVKRVFPNEAIFEFRPFGRYEDIADELHRCRFAFFTSNQLALLPAKSVDLFINMNSLMEMRKEQITHFLALIDQVAGRGFLSRQWLTWRNEADAIVVGKRDFSMPPPWAAAYDQPDDIHPGFFNHVWRRGV